MPRRSRFETEEAEWLGQGDPDTKLCHAHRHNRLDNSRVSASLSLPSQLLVCTLVHSPSFLIPPLLFLCLPLYIFPTFLFYSQFLLSSLAFASCHRRHPFRVVSSSSFPLALSSFLSWHRLALPSFWFFTLFLSHPPLIVSFTFSQPLVEQQLEKQLSVTMIPRVSGFPSPSVT